MYADPFKNKTHTLPYTAVPIAATTKGQSLRAGDASLPRIASTTRTNRSNMKTKASRGTSTSEISSGKKPGPKRLESSEATTSSQNAAKQ